jgi:hypothetical protein
MGCYSLDLRRKIVEAYEKGDTSILSNIVFSNIVLSNIVLSNIVFGSRHYQEAVHLLLLRDVDIAMYRAKQICIAPSKKAAIAMKYLI